MQYDYRNKEYSFFKPGPNNTLYFHNKYDSKIEKYDMKTKKITVEQLE